MASGARSGYFSLGALFLAQVAAIASIAIFSATGGLLFVEMGGSLSLAALPVLAIVIGGAAFAQLHPALFRVAGEKGALILYLAISSIGLFLAKLGADNRDLILMLCGCALFAAQVANAQSYRFIALRQVTTEREPVAMAIIVTGALFGGVLGSLAIMISADGEGTAVSTAPLLLAAAATVSSAVLFVFCSLVPRPSIAPKAEAPALGAALLRKVVGLYACGTVAAATMNLLMLGGPLLLRESAGGLSLIGAAMMGHMIGMYAPSLVAPKLFKMASPVTILFAGLGFGAAGTLFFAASASWAIVCGMVLIGVSWNLLYVTSGILISRVTDANVAVQARFNVLTLTSTAAATAASGPLLAFGGAPLIALIAFALCASGGACVAATWISARAETA